MKLAFRTKLVAMVLGIIALLGAGSYFSMTQMEKNFEHQIQDSFADSASRLGEKIIAQFYERYSDTVNFASNADLRSMNPKVMQPQLNSIVQNYACYDLVIVSDIHGKVVAVNQSNSLNHQVNTKDLVGKDFSNEAWFKDAMNERFTESKEAGLAGAVFVNPQNDTAMRLAFGKTTSAVIIAAPLKDASGKIVGVVSTRSIRWIEEEFTDVYNVLVENGEPGGEMSLVDANGLVLVHYDPHENSGKLDFVYDFEKMNLKANVKDLIQPAGEQLVRGESSSGFSVDPRDSSENVAGFYKFAGKKWMASLGWGVMIQDQSSEVLAGSRAAMRNFLVIFGMAVFVGVALALFFGIAISKTLTSLSTVLTKNSDDVSEASNRIASGASQLSAASVEQAAALQETVAAVDEISAMVDKNADAASRSREASTQSRDAATQGRDVVHQMIQAIEDINKSNDDVSDQMSQNNEQLGQITKLINDIGTKTKVINEIVFQTKLLSFNASVEAARAGEAGKGFAVVAEEVGNLAQMSGNAAKEITTLLDESVRQVEAIVAESKVKVERLISDAREKVRTGAETAKACDNSLGEILTNVSVVDGLVSEIANASQEQALGIREISKAMGQMEQTTQQNTAASESSSVAAEQLRAQSVGLQSVVSDLNALITGSKSEHPDKPAPVAARAAKVTPKEKPAAEKPQVSKVLSMKKRPQEKEPAPAPQAAPMKKVSGDDFAPSSNDPGFEE